MLTKSCRLLNTYFRNFSTMTSVTLDPDIFVMWCAPKTCLISRQKCKINLSVEYNRSKLPDKLEETIDQIWEKRTKENKKLYNGLKFRTHSVITGTSNDLCTFNLGLTNYKEKLGTNLSIFAKDIKEYGTKHNNGNSSTYFANALGVAAIVQTVDKQIVMQKRSFDVGESCGLWDMPGGHAEPKEVLDADIPLDEINIDGIDKQSVVNELFDSILREVRDEMNIPIRYLTDPLILGVSGNVLNYGCPTIEFLIECNIDSNSVQQLYNKGDQEEADESTSIQFIPAADLMDIHENNEMWKTFTPSAKGAIQLYQMFNDGQPTMPLKGT